MVDPRSLRVAAVTLAVDARAAEVVAGFEEAKVPCVLLRGPALAHDLYDAREVRTYRDIDVLVRPDRWEDATAVLGALGLWWPMADAEAAETHSDHAQTWVPRHGGVDVDLHRRLYGLTVDGTWSAVCGPGRRLLVGGRQVTIPDRPGVALIAVLHAAQHGRGDARTLDELQRALRRFSAEEWAQAAARARAGGGEEPFWAGLHLVQAGAWLAARLGLATVQSSPAVRLDAASPPPVAPTLALLSRTPMRGRARVIARKLIPTPAAMRAGWPRARRGKGGLSQAYVLRLVLRSAAVVPGWRAWRQAVRGDG